MEEKIGPFLYRGFGLDIRSDLALPELQAIDDTAPDLTIVRGAVNRPDPLSPAERLHAFDETETYLGVGSVGKFLIAGDRHVTCQLSPQFPDHLAGFALLGPVMASIMHLRGNLVLHGSALEVAGGAVLFLGDKGAGKSTMAGAMVAAGHALITDDVIAASTDPTGRLAVVSAYPTIKLSDTALATFGPDRFQLLPLDAKIPSKQRARIDSAAPRHERTPIVRVYILQRGAADAPARIEPLPFGAALPQLFEHSYMARYGNAPFERNGGRVRHMQQTSAVLNQAGVSRLTVPGSIDRLGDAIALIRQDVAR